MTQFVKKTCRLKKIVGFFTVGTNVVFVIAINQF